MTTISQITIDPASAAVDSAQAGHAVPFRQPIYFSAPIFLGVSWLILLIDQIPGFGLHPQLGPYQVVSALIFLAPATLLWGKAPYARHRWINGRRLRRTSVIGAVIGLCIARLDAVGILAPSTTLQAILSLACLSPAICEWALLRSWAISDQTDIPRKTDLSLSIYDLAVSVGLPLLFFVAAPFQRFPPPGWVDAGIYMGLSLDYFERVSFFGWNYYALRPGYLLPAFLIQNIFPLISGRLILNAAFYALGTYALYTGVRILWGRFAAGIAVAVIAYNPVYLSAITAGYVDGPACAYLLTLFAALALWSRSRNDGWLMAAGASLALVALTHPVTIPPAGIILLFFVILTWDSLDEKWNNIAVFAFGAAIVWLCCAYALSTIGFGINAFKTLFWIASASIGGIGARYATPIESWLPVTTRLFPALLIAATLLLLFKPGLSTTSRRTIGAALVLAIGSGAFLPLYDMAFKGVTTQSLFYAALVLPGSAISFAVVAWTLSPQSIKHQSLVLIVATAVAFATSWFASNILIELQRMAIAIVLPTLCIVAISLAPLLLISRILEPLRGLIVIALVGLQSLALASNADTRQLYYSDKTINNSEFFRAAMFVRETVNSASAGSRRPFFWFHREAFATRMGSVEAVARPWRYNNDTKFLTFYDTVAGMWLWDRSLLSARLKPDNPSFEAGMFNQLTENATIVVLAQDPLAERDAREILGKAGVRCRLHSGKQYDGPSFSLFVTLIDVVRTGQPSVNQCD